MHVAKEFMMTVVAGGHTTFVVDGQTLPGVTSFYINKDAEENDISIELMKDDGHGNLDVVNVEIGL